MNKMSTGKFLYAKGSIEELIQTGVSKVLNIEPSEVIVSRTGDSRFGDFTTPIAMKMAGKLGRNPLEIAEQISKEFPQDDKVSKVEFIKPGFANFYLSSSYLKQSLQEIKETFGQSKEYQGRRIMVEYGQPNTHKSVTVGHVKSAITGLSISRLYENLGYEVIHANYFGDIGPYVAKTLYALISKVKPEFVVGDLNQEVIDSAYALVEEKLKSDGFRGVKEFVSDLYVEASKEFETEDSVTGVVKEINNLLFTKKNQFINQIYDKTRQVCIEYLNDFFGSLGVKYDRQYPESEVSELGKEIVQKNTGGVFVKDDGAIIFPGDKYKMSRWVFLTSEGNPTYSGKEIGLIETKFQEYPDLEFALVTTSVEQNEYFRGVIKAFELIKPEMVGKYRHLGFGWLLLDNKKTSSRKGTVGYDEMIEEAMEIAKSKISQLKEYSVEDIEKISRAIAVAGFKFNILSHEFHKDINYDPKTFMNLSGYSAPYIIYSYTRAMSILAKEKGNIDSKIALETVLNEIEELTLIRKLLEYPTTVNNCAKGLLPHILCEYLYELANTFNSFYTTTPILKESNNDFRNARLVLLEKTALVIKQGLYLLGIEPIEKM